MGTALEIALAPADAFGFLQKEILDKVDAAGPFFGYVSIRVCRQTKTLMGMQQFGDATASVLGDDRGRRLRDAEQPRASWATCSSGRWTSINGGLDAMLHWGLENDRRAPADHLRKTMALRRASAHPESAGSTPSRRCGAGRAPRPRRRSRRSTTRSPSRLWLDDAVVDDDPWSFRDRARRRGRRRKIGRGNSGNAPMRIVGVSPTATSGMPGASGTPAPSRLVPNLEVGPYPGGGGRGRRRL